MEGFRQFIWDSDAWTTGPYCSQDVGYLLTQRGSQTLLGVGVSSFCRGCWLSTDTTTGASVRVGRPHPDRHHPGHPQSPWGEDGWVVTMKPSPWGYTCTPGPSDRLDSSGYSLHHLLAKRSFKRCISFFVFKMKIITVQTPRGC